MRKTNAAMLLLVMTIGSGCATGGAGRTVVGTPVPGSGAVDVTVTARPKAGDDTAIQRVNTYDAAPVRAKPTGEFEHVDYARLTGLIVWLEPAGASKATAPAAAITVRASADVESKNVSPVSVGQEIVLENVTGRPVNFYSVSEGNEFEIEAVPAGATARYMVKTEGLIEIWSNPAKPPVAMFYAAPSSWVATARAGRPVRFEGVAPGEYRAAGWHARLPVSTSDVTASAGGQTSVKITAGVAAIGGAE